MTRRLVNIMDREPDLVTFAITLPMMGMLDDYVAALKNARDVQMRLGNMGAASSLHCIHLLAERGLMAFNQDTQPMPVIPNDRGPD